MTCPFNWLVHGRPSPWKWALKAFKLGATVGWTRKWDPKAFKYLWSWLLNRTAEAVRLGHQESWFQWTVPKDGTKHLKTPLKNVQSMPISALFILTCLQSDYYEWFDLKLHAWWVPLPGINVKPCIGPQIERSSIRIMCVSCEWATQQYFWSHDRRAST